MTRRLYVSTLMKHQNSDGEGAVPITGTAPCHRSGDHSTPTLYQKTHGACRYEGRNRTYFSKVQDFNLDTLSASPWRRPIAHLAISV